MAFVESQAPASNSHQQDEGLMAAGSQRPDGTWRKPVRIKPGYVAPELVPKYKAPHIRRREEEARKAAQGNQTAIQASSEFMAKSREEQKQSRLPTTQGQTQPSVDEEQKKVESIGPAFMGTEHMGQTDQQQKRASNTAQNFTANSPPMSRKMMKNPLYRDVEDSPEAQKQSDEKIFGKKQMYSDRIINDLEAIQSNPQQQQADLVRKTKYSQNPQQNHHQRQSEVEPQRNVSSGHQSNRERDDEEQKQKHNKRKNRRRGNRGGKQQQNRAGGAGHQYFPIDALHISQEESKQMASPQIYHHQTYDQSAHYRRQEGGAAYHQNNYTHF